MNVRSSHLVTPVALGISRWVRLTLMTLTVLLVGLLAVTSLAMGSASAQPQNHTSSTLSADALSTSSSQMHIEQDTTTFPLTCDSGFCKSDCVNVGEMCTPGALNAASTWSLDSVILARAIPPAMPRIARIAAQHHIDPAPPSLFKLSISRT